MVQAVQPQSKFRTFVKTFWDKYRNKNYGAVVKTIPTLLSFEVDEYNREEYQKLCIFAIFSMERSNNVSSFVTDLSAKYKTALSYCDEIAAISSFINAEYFVKEIPSVLHMDFIITVFNKIDKLREWVKDDASRFLKFIIVLVKMESRASAPTFSYAKKAVEMFISKATNKEKKKSGWPQYLLRTLETLESSANGSELVEEHRKLVGSTEQFKKDIAIMIALMIGGSADLVATKPIRFIENMFLILGRMYDIIRDKTLTANFQYRVMGKFHHCDLLDTHVGLETLGSIRQIFLKALMNNNISEAIVSSFTHNILAEGSIYKTLACNKLGSSYEISRTAGDIVKHISKLRGTCGYKRTISTMHRLLLTSSMTSFAIQSVRSLLESREYQERSSQLDKITFFAILLMKAESLKSKIYYVDRIHAAQQDLESPEMVKPIVSIVKELSKIAYGTYDPLHLTLLQMLTVIQYPTRTEKYLEKLIKDISVRDFLKDDQVILTNLLKSCCCYIQKILFESSYKNIIKWSDYYGSLDARFEVNHEIEIIKQLRGALEYLSTFIEKKNIWLKETDKDLYITLTTELLQRIGESLSGRQYKDLAAPSFHLLYDFAKTTEQPLMQTLAAGHLTENVQFVPKAAKKEIVTYLHTTLMKKLRSFDTMESETINIFLLSFLRLALYTARYQHSIKSAKKYMQGISSLLYKYDKNREKFPTIRLKYAEVMFDLIFMDPKSTISQRLFIESVFNRFKSIKCLDMSDFYLLPSILFDLVSTIYAYMLPRHVSHDPYLGGSLINTVHRYALNRGLLSMFAKISILECNLYLARYEKNEKLSSHMSQLDSVFGCKIASNMAIVEKGIDKPKVEWNHDITPLIHSIDCKCFHCTNDYLHLLYMDAAAVKTWAVYQAEDNGKSLTYFQDIYEHWRLTSVPSYLIMLMNYTMCLITNSRKDESREILMEALKLSEDVGITQDITVRLFTDANGKLLEGGKPKAYLKIRRKNEAPSRRFPSDSTRKALKPYPKKPNIRF